MTAPRRVVPRRPDPEPLESDEIRVVAIGTVAWAVLLVATLVLHPWLDDHGNGDWVWIALAGFGLGLLGLWYLRRRRAAIARDAGQGRQHDG